MGRESTVEQEPRTPREKDPAEQGSNPSSVDEEGNVRMGTDTAEEDPEGHGRVAGATGPRDPERHGGVAEEPEGGVVDERSRRAEDDRHSTL
jgi:hypothetical protein